VSPQEFRGHRITNRNPSGKTRRQKPLKAERRATSKAAKGKSSLANLKKEIERQARELEEARQQQAASSRVLHIIGTSPGALTPVFRAIVKNAVELCGARFGAVFQMEGNLLHVVAHYNLGATHRRLFQAMYPMRPNRGHVSGRAILTRSIVQIPDVNADEDYRGAAAKQSGFRSLLAAPLLKGDRAIGSIVIYKAEAGTFTARQLALLQNFAAQAVIAIENARLFNEAQASTHDLQESLQQQTATGEVLKVIASSPTDVGPVLTAIVESACGICEAENAHVALKDGDELLLQAQRGSIPVVWKRQSITRRWVTGRAAVDRRPIHVHDLLSPEGDEFPDGQELARRDGARTVLAVPLMREGECIGVIVLRRMEVRPFSEKQIELLQTFADQP